MLQQCIDAIDVPYVSVCALASRQTFFRGIKINITQNVILSCYFDMKFIYVYVGCESTANDS